MVDIIALIVIVLILGISLGYIRKYVKKNGSAKCIGCPYAESCNHNCENKHT